MADADEDVMTRPGGGADGGDSSDDEAGAMKFLSSIAKVGKNFPKRGEKDFEPDTTALQSNILTASRQAMHDALSFERSHNPRKGHHRLATYHPGLHMAYITRPSGTSIFAKVGHTRSGREDDPFHEDGVAGAGDRLWLLPEEVMYLLERGTLDVRWPPHPKDEDPLGLPMSLQGAYALFIGNGKSERDSLTLERYMVYANLMRMGFAVMRAPSWSSPGPPSDGTCYPPAPVRRTWQLGLLASCSEYLSGLLLSPSTADTQQREETDPLVPPGVYRDYASIYRKLALIPFHDPQAQTQPSQPRPPPTHLDYRVTFHLWKTTSHPFKKSAPGPPDFRIAIIDAEATGIPTVEQLGALVDTTPYNQPDPKQNIFRRLKRGYRDVILAVVDEGVISFLRVADVAFGREKLFDNQFRPSGPKRGGGFGRGRGGRGGRGRGRGRG